MPRTYGKAKQTRLAFAPVTLPQDSDQEADDTNNRHANLRYGHPSMPTIRETRSRVNEPSNGKVPEKLEPSENPVDKGPVYQESEIDDDMPTSARKLRDTRALKRKRSSTPPDAENVLTQGRSHSAPPEDSDDDEITTRPRRKLRRGPAHQPTVVLDDSDEEPVVSSPAKRLRRRERSSPAPQTPVRNLGQDELDLQEDLEDLQESVVKETRTRGRLANSARAQRQQHLEALRRRRAGEEAAADESPSEANEESEGEEDEDESEDESNDEEVIKQPRFRREGSSDVESSIASDEDLDRYEDDFVLEDENDKLGAPGGAEDMPFEFSRHAYKQLKDYFQDAIEWMVFNQLNPAFARSSPVYQVAFSKLENEVKGRTGSQLVSSVWNSNFRRALMARPQLEVTGYQSFDQHPCDACNRSGHPASSDFKFYGKPYSLETLEALSEDNSGSDQSDAEDDAEENSGQDRDRDGRLLPDESTRYLLGRHCANRAKMAHTLIHWRFHLNEWVVEHLSNMGYFNDEEVVKRNHMSQRRKARHAADAMGIMVYEGEIKKLWRDFHITLRAARESAVRPSTTK
ncbi:hypothetical protein BDV25DRAFT_133700 [Aspergillus avenaceus]|uniref:DUF4211 domain-containing protein n=1 Tax=Aspergillus avenaceus TaxID=36643 RepID=A0A5N6TGM4_ASPAV|nr:hypothetical protein BDV25DRAFT_133700 [Aspergillus avenaceus]